MNTNKLREILLNWVGLSEIEQAKATLQDWRDLAFRVTLRITVLAGFVFYPLYVIDTITRKDWDALITTSITYSALLINRYAIPPKFYKKRVILFLSALYYIAIAMGTTETFIGDARVWLVLLVGITEILLGGSLSIIILLIAAGSWFGLGLLFQNGLLEYPYEHLQELIHPEATYVWKNTSYMIFAIGLGLIISIRALIQSLNNSLQQSQELTNNLEKEIEVRKRIEQYFRTSEKKYRGLFENSPLLLMEVDRALNILAINPTMAKSLGAETDNLEGENLGDILPEDILQSRAKKLETAFCNTETLRFDDKRAGKYFLNIFVPSPNAETLQVISQDVTEERKAKQRLLEYHEELNKMVDVKTEQLHQEMKERRQIEAKAFESQKMADIGVLSTGIAHELNSPLQGIITTSDYLLRLSTKKDLDAPTLEKRLERIKESVLRCTKIVDSLYTYAHSAPSEIIPHDIQAIIEDTLVLTRHQFTNYDKISIVTEVEENMPPFLCDKDRIMQILINLLTNARDSMTAGGNLTIQSNYLADQKQFLLRVIDEGEGIPENKLGHIFKPFFTTKKVGEGTGLGLYIVNGLVNARGGEIKVQSSIGEGTVVTVTYPETPPEHPPLSVPVTVPNRVG